MKEKFESLKHLAPKELSEQLSLIQQELDEYNHPNISPVDIACIRCLRALSTDNFDEALKKQHSRLIKDVKNWLSEEENQLDFRETGVKKTPVTHTTDIPFSQSEKKEVISKPVAVQSSLKQELTHAKKSTSNKPVSMNELFDSSSLQDMLQRTKQTIHVKTESDFSLEDLKDSMSKELKDRLDTIELLEEVYKVTIPEALKQYADHAAILAVLLKNSEEIRLWLQSSKAIQALFDAQRKALQTEVDTLESLSTEEFDRLMQKWSGIVSENHLPAIPNLLSILYFDEENKKLLQRAQNSAQKEISASPNEEKEELTIRFNELMHYIASHMGLMASHQIDNLMDRFKRIERRVETSSTNIINQLFTEHLKDRNKQLAVQKGSDDEEDEEDLEKTTYANEIGVLLDKLRKKQDVNNTIKALERALKAYQNTLASDDYTDDDEDEEAIFGKAAKIFIKNLEKEALSEVQDFASVIDPFLKKVSTLLVLKPILPASNMTIKKINLEEFAAVNNLLGGRSKTKHTKEDEPPMHSVGEIESPDTTINHTDEEDASSIHSFDETKLQSHVVPPKPKAVRSRINISAFSEMEKNLGVHFKAKLAEEDVIPTHSFGGKKSPDTVVMSESPNIFSSGSKSNTMNDSQNLSEEGSEVTSIESLDMAEDFVGNDEHDEHSMLASHFDSDEFSPHSLVDEKGDDEDSSFSARPTVFQDNANTKAISRNKVTNNNPSPIAANKDVISKEAGEALYRELKDVTDPSGFMPILWKYSDVFGVPKQQIPSLFWSKVFAKNKSVNDIFDHISNFILEKHPDLATIFPSKKLDLIKYEQAIEQAHLYLNLAQQDLLLISNAIKESRLYLTHPLVMENKLLSQYVNVLDIEHERIKQAIDVWNKLLKEPIEHLSTQTLVDEKTAHILKANDFVRTKIVIVPMELFKKLDEIRNRLSDSIDSASQAMLTLDNQRKEMLSKYSKSGSDLSKKLYLEKYIEIEDVLSKAEIELLNVQNKFFEQKNNEKVESIEQAIHVYEGLVQQLNDIKMKHELPQALFDSLDELTSSRFDATNRVEQLQLNIRDIEREIQNVFAIQQEYKDAGLGGVLYSKEMKGLLKQKEDLDNVLHSITENLTKCEQNYERLSKSSVDKTKIDRLSHQYQKIVDEVNDFEKSFDFKLKRLMLVDIDKKALSEFDKIQIKAKVRLASFARLIDERKKDYDAILLKRNQQDRASVAYALYDSEARLFSERLEQDVLCLKETKIACELIEQKERILRAKMYPETVSETDVTELTEQYQHQVIDVLESHQKEYVRLIKNDMLLQHFEAASKQASHVYEDALLLLQQLQDNTAHLDIKCVSGTVGHAFFAHHLNEFHHFDVSMREQLKIEKARQNAVKAQVDAFLKSKSYANLLLDMGDITNEYNDSISNIAALTAKIKEGLQFSVHINSVPINLLNELDKIKTQVYDRFNLLREEIQALQAQQKAIDETIDLGLMGQKLYANESLQIKNKLEKAQNEFNEINESLSLLATKMDDMRVEAHVSHMIESYTDIYRMLNEINALHDTPFSLFNEVIELEQMRLNALERVHQLVILLDDTSLQMEKIEAVQRQYTTGIGKILYQNEMKGLNKQKLDLQKAFSLLFEKSALFDDAFLNLTIPPQQKQINALKIKYQSVLGDIESIEKSELFKLHRLLPDDIDKAMFDELDEVRQVAAVEFEKAWVLLHELEIKINKQRSIATKGTVGYAFFNKKAQALELKHQEVKEDLEQILRKMQAANDELDVLVERSYPETILKTEIESVTQALQEQISQIKQAKIKIETDANLAPATENDKKIASMEELIAKAKQSLKEADNAYSDLGEGNDLKTKADIARDTTIPDLMKKLQTKEKTLESLVKKIEGINTNAAIHYYFTPKTDTTLIKMIQDFEENVLDNLRGNRPDPTPFMKLVRDNMLSKNTTYITLLDKQKLATNGKLSFFDKTSGWTLQKINTQVALIEGHYDDYLKQKYDMIKLEYELQKNQKVVAHYEVFSVEKTRASVQIEGAKSYLSSAESAYQSLLALPEGSELDTKSIQNDCRNVMKLSDICQTANGIAKDASNGKLKPKTIISMVQDMNKASCTSVVELVREGQHRKPVSIKRSMNISGSSVQQIQLQGTDSAKNDYMETTTVVPVSKDIDKSIATYVIKKYGDGRVNYEPVVAGKLAKENVKDWEKAQETAALDQACQYLLDYKAGDIITISDYPDKAQVARLYAALMYLSTKSGMNIKQSDIKVYASGFERPLSTTLYIHQHLPNSVSFLKPDNEQLAAFRLALESLKKARARKNEIGILKTPIDDLDSGEVIRFNSQ